MAKEILEEIWSRRSLLITLAINDLKLRYRNSVLGFFWSFLEPLLLLTVLYFVFTNIFRSEIENYQLFILMGLIMWNMFARGTTMGMESILNKAGLVSQTYLPREIVVISGVLTSFFMMSFEFLIFFIFMIVFQVIPMASIIVLPLMLGVLLIFTLGTSFALAGLYPYYRDLRSIWGVVVQAGFFATPIIYTMDIFPDNIRSIISLNPMVPILEISRNATIYHTWPQFSDFHYLIIIVILSIPIGYLIFKKYDKKIIEQL